jgi:MoaA/NifB/PqqE/SkfB family radical SAM enzyme
MNDISRIDRGRFHEELVEFSNQASKENYTYPKRYCYILTNLCNLACTFCFQDRKKQKGAMTKEDWINLTDQLPEYARVTLTGGEPIVFNGFKEVFHSVASRFECNMITNGLLLTEELIDFFLSYENFKVLSISIDNVKNTIRKQANIKELNWDKKWNHVEKMMRYFQKRKTELGNSCTLDSKTVVLDENASDLFDIHKYCIEDLECDTHSFQFLKGSPIQHSDLMFDYNEIFKKSFAPTYKHWNIIVSELKKVKKYNIEKTKYGFLHPQVTSLTDGEAEFDIDYLNNIEHDKKLYKACNSPWMSVHVNVDGNLFPCLAIPMGDVRDGLKNILEGQKFKEFRDTIKRNGTVEACNRCGWLKPCA